MSRRQKRSISRSTALILIAGFLRAAGILDVSLPARDVPHMVMRSWRAEDGLPQNKVSAIQQTRDGYIWVGTYSGLARFDGVSFTVFHDNNTPAMRNSRVTSLFEAPDLSLWIGHESGDVTRLENGVFEAVAMPASWAAGKIHTITADGRGDIWVLSENGLVARLRDGRVLSPSPGGVAKIVQMTALRNGAIAVDREGLMSLIEEGELRLFEPHVVTTNSYVQGIGASPSGDLWVMSDLRVRRWSELNEVEDLGPAPWDAAPVHTMLETRMGLLAAGTADNGLFFGWPGGEYRQFSRATGFPSDWITALHEDREGNLWVGTGNNGVVLIRLGLVRTIAPPDQWQGRPVLAVTGSRDGALWVGTEGAGLYQHEKGNWVNYGADKGFGNPYIWSLGEDVSGNVWAGTWFAGLLVRDGSVFRTVAPLEEAGGPLLAILPARSGGLWIGGATGLLRYRNGRSVWHRRAGNTDLRDVNSIVEDGDGAVWFGMASGGIGCLQDGEIRLYNRQDGLSSGSIQCLHMDSEGVLWIGTSGGGLNRFKNGKFAAVGRQHGLANSVICNVQDDGRGYFWLSSHGGIMRVSKEQLNACADGLTNSLQVLHLGLSDGLPTLECTGGLQPAGCRTPDGRLWFPTTKGLVTLNPEEVRTNPLPPPVVFEEMLVDGKPISQISSSGIAEVGPGRHHFEFRYTGLSFVAPEKVRFRCQLEGLEPGWTDNGTLRSMVYNFIPPGRYTFRVTACNNDGVWNETGAQVSFEVLPFFWQTAWFRTVVVITLIGAASAGVWYATRRRMRRKLERIERQRTLERERSRIARDIHDDLGASLTRITMLSQVSEAARGDAAAPSVAVRNLDLIYSTARELTRAMDEIVWAVNPSHDTLDSMASYLGKFAQDYLRVAGIRCRLDVPLQLPTLSLTAEVRHNMFLAFKEALNNIVKHSGATEVRVTLSVGSHSLAWEIEDNGCGFDPAHSAQGNGSPDRISSGNGVVNMKRRLAEAGGECEVRSAPGLGTQVKFTVPVPGVAAEVS